MIRVRVETHVDSTGKRQAFNFDVTVALAHHMTGPGPTKRLDFECTGMPPYPYPHPCWCWTCPYKQNVSL